MKGSRPISGIARILVYCALVLFCAVQLRVLLGPKGIVATHDLTKAFSTYFDLSLADPVMTAGMIDFFATYVVMLIVIIEGVPRTKDRAFWIAIALVAGSVFPGLAALGFLALFWRNRDQFMPSTGQGEELLSGHDER